MLYPKYRNRKTGKFKKLIIVGFAFIIVCVIFCEKQIDEFKPVYVQNQAHKLSAEAVCMAVDSTLENLKYNYDDICKIMYSSDGNVKSIETDSVKINAFKSEITKSAQNLLGEISDASVDIPLGVFTGITILSNIGPGICVGFNMTGSFTAEIVSTFENAGINQTVHHIRLIVTSKIITTSLDYSGDIIYTTDFEIAQTVIVGTVPDYYKGSTDIY
ncbi:MAG: sporulation protein YunB [Ruminococcus sp.]|nr:sporulation protein YunB [Ruminococcus sp.]